jgi:plastocyanin
MKSKVGQFLALLMVLGLVAAGCSKKSTGTTSGTPSSDESSVAQITIGSDKANDHGTKTVSGGSLEVELDSFYFNPTTIKGPAGSQVKIELANDSSTLHNFSLTDQSIDQDVTAEGKAEVTVTIPQSGFAEFFCKYHKGSGMVGQLQPS